MSGFPLFKTHLNPFSSSHTHICTHTHMHTLMQTHTHTRICTNTHMHVNTLYQTLSCTLFLSLSISISFSYRNWFSQTHTHKKTHTRKSTNLNSCFGLCEQIFEPHRIRQKCEERTSHIRYDTALVPLWCVLKEKKSNTFVHCKILDHYTVEFT